MDREKEVQQVPLENPNDAQPGVIDIDLTPEEAARLEQVVVDPKGLAEFISEVRARRSRRSQTGSTAGGHMRGISLKPA